MISNSHLKKYELLSYGMTIASKNSPQHPETAGTMSTRRVHDTNRVHLPNLTSKQQQRRGEKMKKGDFLWLLVFCLVSSVMLVPASHAVLVSLTKNHPFVMGFIKFAVLATMGELMTIRLIGGDWKKPAGIIPRTVVWGLIGMLLVLMFEIFNAGVGSAIAKGLIWSGEGALAHYLKAFWISVIMNCFFAPVFMIGHRITDTYIDMSWGEGVPLSSIAFPDVIDRIDWEGLFTFVIQKTIPFFWIPAHTVTFITPPEYRVLFAAYLSIALGAILAYAKRGSRPSESGPGTRGQFPGKA